ncbi:MAG: flagellum-specific ATP synthase FliI [Deltaproteobacteria bacterium RIFOXYD12_FULL_56_24]|nr:MAG: flagellum-specific ATP synthase FliI [Deltaproteobacteria bacterium RIFOXYD12_FULL_56_24]
MNLSHCLQVAQDTSLVSVGGRVNQVIGMVLESLGPGIPVGSICEVSVFKGKSMVLAEVVGFREGRVLLMPLGEMRGVEPGSAIRLVGGQAGVPVAESLLGRVIDGLGNPMDGKGPLRPEALYPLYAEPLNPMERERILKPVDVGVRAINGLLTLGKGQRIGILAGSGVGKSTLLGMIARHTAADISVIALIGERGRELKDFIERDLGPVGLARSVVVVATSDQPPLVRMRGAYLATAISEFFRDKGRDVILMMDSVTRFAMSSREVGLAIGEPPTSRGYTPSVFGQLPKLLERAGTCMGKGSITGIYTVLVEGDDMNEPIADAVRSIVDGHIILSRDLASQGHYPSIEVMGSVSRCMTDVVPKDQVRVAHKFLEVMATYRRSEDLINIGAYAKGSNPKIDNAIAMIDRLNGYLKQPVEEKVSFAESARQLAAIFAGS